MELTRFTDIGLRIVMRLAADDEAVTSREIARQLQVPYTHVAKVVARLSELGVVHTRRGRTGGLAVTELGREAHAGWLARQLEGDQPIIDCNHPTPCPLLSVCQLRGALAEARNAFFDDLDRHTIADLVTPDTSAVLLSLSSRSDIAEVEPTTKDLAL